MLPALRAGCLRGIPGATAAAGHAHCHAQGTRARSGPGNSGAEGFGGVRRRPPYRHSRRGDFDKTGLEENVVGERRGVSPTWSSRTRRTDASTLAAKNRAMTFFNSKLEEVVKKHPRYAYEAYEFMFQALNFTQKMLGREPPEDVAESGAAGPQHHVSGQELLEGI